MIDQIGKNYMKSKQNKIMNKLFLIFLSLLLVNSCKDKINISYVLNITNDSNTNQYYLLNQWFTYNFYDSQDIIIIDTNNIMNCLIINNIENKIKLSRSPNAMDDNNNVYPSENKPIFLKLLPNFTAKIEFIYKNLENDNILANDSIFLYSSLIYLNENNIDKNCIIISNLKNIKFEYNENKLLLNLPEIKITDEEQIFFQDKYFNHKIVKLENLVKINN